MKKTFFTAAILAAATAFAADNDYNTPACRPAERQELDTFRGCWCYGSRL